MDKKNFPWISPIIEKTRDERVKELIEKKKIRTSSAIRQKPRNKQFFLNI